MAVNALRASAREGLGAVRSMTALTGQEVVRPPDLERPKVMVDLLVELPALKRVALRAVAPLRALVHVEVTARAVGGERLVGVVEVALLALYALVLVDEGVAALGVVIKGHARPRVGDVAGVAGLVDLTLMEVLMAVSAACVDGLEVALFVARLTALQLVLTRELKARLAVVKEGHRPALSARVTLPAVPACELPPVHLLAVTERALLARVILHLGAVRVTAITGLLLVARLKREARDAVVKARALPAHRGVTL